MSPPYSVERPEEHSGVLVVALGVCVAAGLALVVALSSYRAVDVHVDGGVLRTRSGASADEVGRLSGVEASPGDLRSVRGILLEEGAGAPPLLRAGSRTLAPHDRVYAGDEFVSLRGPDVRESLVTTIVAVEPPLTIEGTGPVEKIVTTGVPGVARVKRGVVSGVGVATETLVAAKPRVVRHEGYPRGTKFAVLTFDDGPWKGQTEKILRILDQHDVKATFFMLGLRVRVNPALARRVVAEGHTVGNHSWSHEYLQRAKLPLIRSELTKGQRVIRDTTGVEARWYRPAGGMRNAIVYREAARMGLGLVTWNVEPSDYRRPPSSVLVRRVIGQSIGKDRAIILLHDGGGERSQTIKALPRIIRALKARDYVFVTLDQLAAADRAR